MLLDKIYFINKPKNITKFITLYYIHLLVSILIIIYFSQSNSLIQLNYDYILISNYLTLIFSNNSMLDIITNLLLDYTILHLIGFLLCILLNIILY